MQFYNSVTRTNCPFWSMRRYQVLVAAESKVSDTNNSHCGDRVIFRRRKSSARATAACWFWMVAISPTIPLSPISARDCSIHDRLANAVATLTSSIGVAIPLCALPNSNCRCCTSLKGHRIAKSRTNRLASGGGDSCSVHVIANKCEVRGACAEGALASEPPSQTASPFPLPSIVTPLLAPL